jgi:hypothetical protein
MLVASAIALVAVVGLGSGTAFAENTCETANGEATVGEKTEKQHLINKLNVNLSGPERLFFGWEGGAQKFQLKLLTRAACHAGRTASTFSGGGLGFLNKEAGYSISFSIKVTAEGEAFLKAKIKHKAELIAEFEEELENSTEEIA